MNVNININDLYINKDLNGDDLKTIISDNIKFLIPKFITINSSLDGGIEKIINQESNRQIRFWNVFDSSNNQIEIQITPDSSLPYSFKAYSSNTYDNLRVELICY